MFGLPVNGAHMVAPHLLLAYPEGKLRILDAKPVRQPIGGGEVVGVLQVTNSIIVKGCQM